MAITPAWPSLSQANCQGTTNAKVKANVKALQCLLNYRNGNTALLDDGDFGSVSAAAVKSYQSKNGLVTDGIAGSFTLARLIVDIKSTTNGSAAKAAQHLLSKFATIVVDGNFGTTSDGIAKTFQGKMGLLQDGLIGRVSWQYLFGYLAYQSTGAPSALKYTSGAIWPTLSQVICKGTANPGVKADVKALQCLLNYRVGSNLLVDGDFGNATTAAVKSFQSKNGLYVDGVAGPKTLPKLVTTVQSGTTTSAVAMAAQILMGKFMSVVADGLFGSVTVAAAKVIQQVLLITQTGTIDSTTWQNMFSANVFNSFLAGGSNMTFWGMDAETYPGDGTMQTIWNESPMKFTGFYLAPARTNTDASWMTKFSTLRSQGWGIAPIYSGYQYKSNSQYLTKEQGVKDAGHAVSLAKQAGIPISYRIYLDVENGGLQQPNFMNYISAWLFEVGRIGGHKPGVYCSYSDTAGQIADAMGILNSGIKYWCYNLDDPHYGKDARAGTGSLTAPNPAGCGILNAISWQLQQNVYRTYGSAKVKIDIDASTSTNPGLV